MVAVGDGEETVIPTLAGGISRGTVLNQIPVTGTGMTNWDGNGCDLKAPDITPPPRRRRVPRRGVHPAAAMSRSRSRPGCQAVLSARPLPLLFDFPALCPPHLP